MNKQKILVIGSNSFTGSHFVAEALKEGHPVWGVSRSKEPNRIFLPYRWPKKNSSYSTTENYKFTRIDIKKGLKVLLELIDAVKPELIVNFAAQGMVAESWLNPTDWYKTNLVAQVALHDELRRKKYLQKYVHVTTPEVYGSTNGKWIKENNYYAPSTPYAVSRAACDLHLQSFHDAYGFPVIFTRAANVYGPGQQLYRIIPRSLLSCRTDSPLKLHGGGNSERSFIYIEDVVKATLLLAKEAEPGSTWHLSTKESHTIIDLVKNIFKITNADFEKLVETVDERLGKDQSYLLDSSSIRKVHGWEDKVSLKEGLRETLNWVDKNLEVLKKLRWDYQHKS